MSGKFEIVVTFVKYLVQENVLLHSVPWLVRPNHILFPFNFSSLNRTLGTAGLSDPRGLSLRNIVVVLMEQGKAKSQVWLQVSPSCFVLLLYESTILPS